MNYKYILAISLLLAMAACEKDEDSTPTPSPSPYGYPVNCPMNYSQAYSVFAEVVKIADQAAATGSYVPCAAVTFDSASSVDPDTLRIDFGTVNCLDSDGRNRRGVIVCVYNGNYFDSLTTKLVTFINYFVNDCQLTGTINITNSGRDALGRTGCIYLSSGTFIKTSGTITLNSSNTFLRTAGELTPALIDDVWIMNGTASGTSDSGLNFTATIVSSFVRTNTCVWLTQGAANITPAGKTTSVVDFGTGGCDNQAILIVEGNLYSFSLF